jgi:hypothetical protein
MRNTQEDKLRQVAEREVVLSMRRHGDWGDMRRRGGSLFGPIRQECPSDEAKRMRDSEEKGEHVSDGSAHEEVPMDTREQVREGGVLTMGRELPDGCDSFWGPRSVPRRETWEGPMRDGQRRRVGGGSAKTPEGGSTRALRSEG